MQRQGPYPRCRARWLAGALMDAILQAALNAYHQALVAELLTLGWTPPAGWSQADTDGLGHMLIRHGATWPPIALTQRQVAP